MANSEFVYHVNFVEVCGFFSLTYSRKENVHISDLVYGGGKMY